MWTASCYSVTSLTFDLFNYRLAGLVTPVVRDHAAFRTNRVCSVAVSERRCIWCKPGVRVLELVVVYVQAIRYNNVHLFALCFITPSVTRLCRPEVSVAFFPVKASTTVFRLSAWHLTRFFTQYASLGVLHNPPALTLQPNVTESQHRTCLCCQDASRLGLKKWRWE